MKKMTCCDCRNYVQHYGLFHGRLQKIYCGHCMKSHIKRKRPDTAACAEFILGEATMDKMVTKEYLTKEFLQHMLQMGLWQEEYEKIVELCKFSK